MIIFLPEFVCRKILFKARYKKGKNTSPLKNIVIPLLIDTCSSHCRSLTVRMENIRETMDKST